VCWEIIYCINANGGCNINQTPYLCNKLCCPLLQDAAIFLHHCLLFGAGGPILGLAEWAVGPTRAPRAIACIIAIWIRLTTIALIRRHLVTLAICTSRMFAAKYKVAICSIPVCGGVDHCSIIGTCVANPRFSFK
jgi:hypothetical protein